MKNEKFSLKIKDNTSGGYKNIYYNDSLILTNFDKIYEQINKINELQTKKKEQFAIILEHPKIEIITIKNKEEWNFLYNYNIINECINKNKLKINHKKIGELMDKDNFNNIIKYIIEEKIPKSFYFNVLINFIIYKNYLEEFKLYFLNELFNSDLDKLKDKVKINNNLIDKEITNKKENKDIQKTINKIQIPETIDFLNIFNRNYLNSFKFIDSIDNIKAIFNDKNDKNEEMKKKDPNKINKTMIKNEINSDNDSNSSDNDEGPQNKSNFNCGIKNNLLLLESKAEEKTYFDNNKKFKKFNKKEYYIGIEDFKDKLNRKFYD